MLLLLFIVCNIPIVSLQQLMGTIQVVAVDGLNHSCDHYIYIKSNGSMLLLGFGNDFIKVINQYLSIDVGDYRLMTYDMYVVVSQDRRVDKGDTEKWTDFFADVA